MGNDTLYVRTIRKKIILSLLVVVPLGFLSKFYSGPASTWINDSLGGVFYEIFWCLIIALVWVKLSTWKIVLWVFGVTSILEILQLWHPETLEMIRSTFLGRTLIGIQFAWLDFPYYMIGCLIGWFWIGQIHKSIKL